MTTYNCADAFDPPPSPLRISEAALTNKSRSTLTRVLPPRLMEARTVQWTGSVWTERLVATSASTNGPGADQLASRHTYMRTTPRSGLASLSSLLERIPRTRWPWASATKGQVQGSLSVIKLPSHDPAVVFFLFSSPRFLNTNLSRLCTVNDNSGDDDYDDDNFYYYFGSGTSSGGDDGTGKSSLTPQYPSNQASKTANTFGSADSTCCWSGPSFGWVPRAAVPRQPRLGVAQCTSLTCSQKKN